MEAERAYHQEKIKLEHNHTKIIGQSDVLKYVPYKVEQIASSDTTVLILGETGTGKELIARATHDTSLRKNRTLIKVNCASLINSFGIAPKTYRSLSIFTLRRLQNGWARPSKLFRWPQSMPYSSITGLEISGTWKMYWNGRLSTRRPQAAPG